MTANATKISSLDIPERNLAEVISIIRAGLRTASPPVTSETGELLSEWCDEEERREYEAHIRATNEDW